MENLLNATARGFILFGREITWYGVIIAVGMIIGVIMAYLICKKKGYNLNMPLDLAIAALPCAIVGARIYYCVFNGVDSFGEIFAIWDGGMAIYGGVIGGFLGVLLCCKIKKYKLLQACDICAPCLLLGQAIGRIGCYYSSCCYGIETTNPDLQFFPISVQIDGVWHLANFFYESFFNLIGVVVLLIITAKTKNNGYVTAGYFIIYGVIRAVLESFRDPAQLLTIGSSSIGVSLVLSLILVAVGFVIIIFNLKNKAKNKEAEVNE